MQNIPMVKRLLRVASTASMDSVLNLSAAMQAPADTTADNKEAMTAFLEKRPPNFSGD